MSSPLRRVLAAWLLAALVVSPALAQAEDAPSIVDPFAAPAPAPAATIPVDPRAAAELDEVVKAMPAGEERELDLPLARAEYLEKRVEIDTRAGHPVGRLGPDGDEVSGGELYLALGRPDLASRYRQRLITRWSLLVVSGVTLGLGLGLAIDAEERACAPGYGHGACVEAARIDADRQRNWGTGAAVLGAAVFAVTWTMLRADPISTRQAARLARRHNRFLRRTLGVVDVALVPAPGTLTLAPSFRGGAPGLALTGSF